MVLAFDPIALVFVRLRRSALFEMGNTMVIAAVYGPREVVALPTLITLIAHIDNRPCA